ncbi:hypothetical protein DCC62_27825 [candidate division KSB1 bacterium]|nr:MAG: hypothetical protein DCC62_27825 [candidate division KSB1 bacterium]
MTAIACMAWLVAMLGTSSAQEWRKLREEGANFYDVKRSFEQAEAQALQNALLKKGADEEGFEDEAKVPGYTSFKRWEYWMEPRVYPSGNLPDPDQDFKAMQQYFQRHGALMKGAATPDAVATAIPSANWTGPNLVGAYVKQRGAGLGPRFGNHFSSDRCQHDLSRHAGRRFVEEHQWRRELEHQHRQPSGFGRLKHCDRSHQYEHHVYRHRRQ